MAQRLISTRWRISDNGQTPERVHREPSDRRGVERCSPMSSGSLRACRAPQLEEIEGDVFRGVVKVKLGRHLDRVQGPGQRSSNATTTAHRAVLKAEGRDTTGKGNASALITARLEPVDRRLDEVQRRDRPAHHRQGRPVRPRHHGRRQQEADEPVRHEPQHDARSTSPDERRAGQRRDHCCRHLVH